MARTTDARAKAIETAERLFRVQGYAATGLSQVIEESGAPKGSFYFHFPGGKRELAAEVLATYRARTSGAFRILAEKAHTPEQFVRGLTGTIAREMLASEWTMGCAAQTLAQELAPGDGDMAEALGALFDEWVRITAAAIGPPGDPRSARSRALALIAALEGARTLARALRSTAPFDAVAEQFVARIPNSPQPPAPTAAATGDAGSDRDR